MARVRIKVEIFKHNNIIWGYGSCTTEQFISGKNNVYYLHSCYNK